MSYHPDDNNNKNVATPPNLSDPNYFGYNLQLRG